MDKDNNKDIGLVAVEPGPTAAGVLRALRVFVVIAVLLLAGCGAFPAQTAGTAGDVAGDLTQTVEQRVGIAGEQLLAGGMAGLCFLLAVMLTCYFLPNPKSIEGKVAVALMIAAFLAIGGGLLFTLIQGG